MYLLTRYLFQRNDGRGDVDSENVNFAWQHDVRVHNKPDKNLALSLINNTTMKNRDKGPSTEMVINVDLVNKKAWRTSDLTDSADSIVSATPGRFQLLQFQRKEHMLAGYWWMPKFKEFDRSGNVTLQG